MKPCKLQERTAGCQGSHDKRRFKMSMKERKVKKRLWVKKAHSRLLRSRQEDDRMVENENVANHSAMGWAENIKWV